MTSTRTIGPGWTNLRHAPLDRLHGTAHQALPCVSCMAVSQPIARQDHAACLGDAPARRGPNRVALAGGAGARPDAADGVGRRRAVAGGMAVLDPGRRHPGIALAQDRLAARRRRLDPPWPGEAGGRPRRLYRHDDPRAARPHRDRSADGRRERRRRRRRVGGLGGHAQAAPRREVGGPRHAAALRRRDAGRDHRRPRPRPRPLRLRGRGVRRRRLDLDDAGRGQDRRHRRLRGDGSRLRRRDSGLRRPAASAASRSSATRAGRSTPPPASRPSASLCPATTAKCSRPRSTAGRAARSRSASPTAVSAASSSRPRPCAPGAGRMDWCGSSKGRAPGGSPAASRRPWPATVRWRASSTTSSPNRAASSGSPRPPASAATRRRCGGRRIRSSGSTSRSTPPSRMGAAASGSRRRNRSLELAGDTWRVHPLPPDTQTVTNQTSSLAMLPDGRLAMTANEPGHAVPADVRSGARHVRAARPPGGPLDAAAVAWTRRPDPGSAPTCRAASSRGTRQASIRCRG